MAKFILIAFSLLCLPTAQAEPLGRLFFTPGERAAMGAAIGRESEISGFTAAEGDSTAAPPANALTFNGYVQRSGGKNTVWLNGKPHRESAVPQHLNVSEKNRPPGEIAVKLPESGRVYSLKVGQTLTPGSGEISEGYRLPAPPAKPIERAAKPGVAPKSPPSTAHGGLDAAN